MQGVQCSTHIYGDSDHGVEEEQERNLAKRIVSSNLIIVSGLICI